MRFFVPASQVLAAAEELRAADRMPGGYVFEADPIGDSKPAPPVWRCKYHDVIDCFACQFQNRPAYERR